MGNTYWNPKLAAKKQPVKQIDPAVFQGKKIAEGSVKSKGGQTNGK